MGWHANMELAPAFFDKHEEHRSELRVISEHEELYEECTRFADTERKLDPNKVQLCRVDPPNYPNGQPCACPKGTCSLWKGGLCSHGTLGVQTPDQWHNACNKHTTGRWLCSRAKGHDGPCDSASTEGYSGPPIDGVPSISKTSAEGSNS